MKIRSKIFAIVGVLGVATVVVCGMGLYAMSQVRAMTEVVKAQSDDNFASELILGDITDVALSTRSIWMAADGKAAKAFADNMTDDFAEIDATIASMKDGLDDQERESFGKFLALYAPFAAERKENARVGVEVGPAQALAALNGAEGAAKLAADREAVNSSTRRLSGRYDGDVEGL